MDGRPQERQGRRHRGRLTTRPTASSTSPTRTSATWSPARPTRRSSTSAASSRSAGTSWLRRSSCSSRRSIRSRRPRSSRSSAARRRRQRRRRGGGSARRRRGAAKAAQGAPQIFKALGERLAKTPALAKEVGAVVQVVVTDPDRDWTRRPQDGAPSAVEERHQARPTSRSRSPTRRSRELAKGESLRDHYQRGQVRVDGDARVAPKLNFFKGLV